MIVVIDNYDSFTYNLVQRIGELGSVAPEEIRVYRNDVIDPEMVETDDRPDHLIISPGPCTPNEAGLSCDFIRHFHGKVPILGVCLGHQCIAQVFGGKIVRAERLMHGKTSLIFHDCSGIFAGIPNPFEATRYHSLLVEKETIPDSFKITAWTEENEIMGLQVKGLPLFGVQFHPESILTKEGINILRNFLKI